MTARVLLLLVLAAGASTARAADEYAVDPAASHVDVHVAKAGVLSFVAGHSHEVVAPVERGTIVWDPANPRASRVSMAVSASALNVTGKGEPPADVPRVQETMDSDQVLDVSRYPAITFESTDVRFAGRRGAGFDVVVDGRLTVHGVTRAIHVPVHVETSGDALTASGRFSIDQRDFGITPLSIGGVVRVKNALSIDLAIAARRRRPS